jgi:dipeptidyl aminopeptidase/acylaminoacyl peptidase
MATGGVCAISPDDMYIYEYDWSPNGERFVALAAAGSGNNNWFIARLYTVGVSGRAWKELTDPGMQAAVPRWSPDGRSIAYIGGLMSDEGSNGGDIYVVSAEGGKAKNVTPEMKASASWLAWAPSSQEILFAGHFDGQSGIARANVADGTVTTIYVGDESFSAEGWGPALSVSRDQQVTALLRSSLAYPPEVAAGPIGKWQRVSSGNQGVKPSWGKVVSLHWPSDEWTVQGWLVFPRDYQPERLYPMVVSVHGGPASSRRPAWPRSFFDFTMFSDHGYFVFFPNPRGSYGQGEKFTRANVKDFGHGDLRDIMAGVDFVAKTHRVDRDRVGIGGWSYGGYMTMWTVTQTNRFKTAVAGAGIANWQSYYGENGIDQWLIPYFGASVYDDPAVYAKSSPITYIKNVRTPTLILVGDRDVECPVPQSYEFWHALRTLKVPTQFVVYPNEGHMIAKAEHRRDILRRTIAWFDKYLKEGSAAEAAPEGKSRP